MITTPLDQSCPLLGLILQVNMCNPSEMQHLSVYNPDPSHLDHPVQFPKDHPNSNVGLYIVTSKQFDVGSTI